MVDPEVVSRLLAAIDERAEAAEAASRTGMAFMWARQGGRATLQRHLALSADPDLVRRLCQSHRDIVARHSPVTIQVYDPVKYGHTNPSDFADEQACVRCGTPSEYPVAWPCADLIDLARGYGVEDGETK